MQCRGVTDSYTPLTLQAITIWFLFETTVKGDILAVSALYGALRHWGTILESNRSPRSLACSVAPGKHKILSQPPAYFFFMRYLLSIQYVLFYISSLYFIF